MGGGAENRLVTPTTGAGALGAERLDRRDEDIAAPHVKLSVEAMVFTC